MSRSLERIGRVEIKEGFHVLEDVELQEEQGKDPADDRV